MWRRANEVEPVVGLEPTTDGLQNRCSTTELNWQSLSGAKAQSHRPACNKAAAGRFVKRNCSLPQVSASFFVVLSGDIAFRPDPAIIGVTQ